MFERFTSSSRRVMVFTQKIAKERGDDFVSGTHIALGLIEADRQSEAGLFARLGVDVAELEAALNAEADRDKDLEEGGERRGSPRFTPLAKKTLEMSLREALRLRQNWIGPGHMLLGILNSAGSTALVERLKLDEARAAIAQWEADQPASDHKTSEEGESNETVATGFTEVMKAAMTNGTKPVGSQHLLLGMFQAGETLARKVLESLGVTEQKVWDAIESIGTDGTIDAPPEREYEVRVGEHTIRVDDPKSRDLLRRVLDDDPELAEQIRAAIDRKSKEDS